MESPLAGGANNMIVIQQPDGLLRSAGCALSFFKPTRAVEGQILHVTLNKNLALSIPWVPPGGSGSGIGNLLWSSGQYASVRFVPTLEQLAWISKYLEAGRNDVTYTLQTPTHNQELKACVFHWKYYEPVVIIHVDGTITKYNST